MEISTYTFPRSLVAPSSGLLQASLGSHVENAEGLMRARAYAEADTALLLGVEEALKVEACLYLWVDLRSTASPSLEER